MYNGSMEERVSPIGVAVSGGADSMVLLHYLRARGERVAVINVDHGLRGEESTRDSAFVKAYCAENGIPIFAFRVDTISYSEREGISLELAARQLRYKVFERLLKRKDVSKVALAHHLNDQAETILMRLFRGTGVRGMRGIVDRDGYVHPLLSWTKEEILAYAEREGVKYVTDSSNYDERFTRNYVRNRLVPLIEEAYPGFLRVMGKTAEQFGELEEYLEGAALPFERDGECVRLGAEVWALHPVLRKKSFQEALRKGMGVEKDVEGSHLEALNRLNESGTGARLSLPGGVEAHLEYGAVVFMRKREREPFLKAFRPDEVYEYAGWEVRFAPAAEMVRGVSFDLDKVPRDAVVRTRYAGDVFCRCGGKQKSLSDYFIDEKVPARVRSERLLLASGNRVLAVLGQEVSEEIKIDENTRRIYRVICTNEEVSSCIRT